MSKAAQPELLGWRAAVVQPLAWAFVVAVVISGEQGRPAPGLAGVRLGITAALAVCAVAAAVGLNPRWAERGLAAQAVVTGLLGAGGRERAAPARPCSPPRSGIRAGR